jgi:hypothetical protein
MTLAQPTAKSVVDAAIAELNLGDVVTLDQTDVVLESERNAANGFLGLTGDGSIEAVISIRQGTEAELDDLVPADGELLAILDSNGKPTSLRLGDGTAQLGNVLTGSYVIVPASQITLANSTTYADVDSFVIPIEPNEIIEVFVQLYWVHTVDGVKFQLSRSNSNIDLLEINPTPTETTGFAGSFNNWEYVWPSPSAPIGKAYFRGAHFILFGRSGLPSGNTVRLQAARVAATNVDFAVINPKIIVRRLV